MKTEDLNQKVQCKNSISILTELFVKAHSCKISIKESTVDFEENCIEKQNKITLLKKQSSSYTSFKSMSCKKSVFLCHLNLI